ncbi:uncharacterized protein LOC124888120 [Capsicum annuum]|uniref:uncharacterized protein LOC124888120 n=1 Tax=Capsicum annuum TaxID=4072 RepID=UPI001FB095A1|nr:uncharacterized protein LOC124888120 [Capsicum annuum]
MVTSWILNSLSKEIAESVGYVANSTKLWKELEDRYDQTNGAKLYQIQKEISDLVQESMDITTYYTRMKKLWEEFNNLSFRVQCSCQCVYGAKEGTYKAEQDRRLIQFLMGLNGEYTSVRESILMMNPLPTLAKAFFILIQEEKQREFKQHNRIVMESTSLHVNSAGSRSYSGPSNTGSYKKNYLSQNFVGSSNNSKPSCDYCKRPGHTKDRYYKLHGYPQNNAPSGPRQSYQSFPISRNAFMYQHQNFGLYKSKRIVANVHGFTSNLMHTHGDEPDSIMVVKSPNISKDQ